MKGLGVALRNSAIFGFCNGKSRKDGIYWCVKKQKGLRPGTLNKRFICYKKFYRWAVKGHLCERDPFEDVKSLRADEYAGIVF